MTTQTAEVTELVVLFRSKFCSQEDLDTLGCPCRDACTEQRTGNQRPVVPIPPTKTFACFALEQFLNFASDRLNHELQVLQPWQKVRVGNAALSRDCWKVFSRFLESRSWNSEDNLLFVDISQDLRKAIASRFELRNVG